MPRGLPTRVGAPQDDLADDGKPDGTVNALRLEKLQAEPDRTLGQTLSCSNDQNKARRIPSG